MIVFRNVGRYENRGVPVSFGGHNLTLQHPPVETRLTDLSKIGDDRPDIEALEIEKLFVYFFGHVLNTMFLNNKVMCNW